MAAGRSPPTFLLLGAAGGGKSLLVRRLRQLSAEQPAELGEPPATLPTVGTNLTDLRLPRRVTVRELGGCMGPIWPSYYSECSALLVGEQRRGRGPGVLPGDTGSWVGAPVSPRCGIPSAVPRSGPARPGLLPAQPLPAFPVPCSSWWTPPTPRSSPRPASSCSRCSPPRRSPPCPSWCSLTRLTCPATCRWWR
ncbi:ADP-ribosylation factor-like protein 16 [Melospiza georgiana]|uniref:ADP-ribosylation factor-like protein 16 n=1 Tax=Melospiza georgiana TaxID=44398 RepID=UPI0025AC3F85|nr:ADP-ribosylation factor-like protein 16 [Melospiza georgiana]